MYKKLKFAGALYLKAFIMMFTAKS